MTVHHLAPTAPWLATQLAMRGAALARSEGWEWLGAPKARAGLGAPKARAGLGAPKARAGLGAPKAPAAAPRAGLGGLLGLCSLS